MPIIEIRAFRTQTGSYCGVIRQGDQSWVLSHLKKKTHRGAIGAARRVAQADHPTATIIEKED